MSSKIEVESLSWREYVLLSTYFLVVLLTVANALLPRPPFAVWLAACVFWGMLVPCGLRWAHRRMVFWLAGRTGVTVFSLSIDNDHRFGWGYSPIATVVGAASLSKEMLDVRK